MIGIDSITLEVADPGASKAFYTTAFGLSSKLIRARTAEATAVGFRGFSISLIAGQPSTVDSWLETAVAAGANTLKPAAKGIWGYGATLEDADGFVWKLATSSKKEKGPATREIDDIVVLLGAEDIVASKRFYLEHGLTVRKSYPGYVDFEKPEGGIALALYKGRKGVAKQAGVSSEGSGSHGIALISRAGQFSDPDGFVWETR
jgi:catechol 2,3-dioxygenase-like lactoylglutathione lyase family enzyme